MTIRFAFLACLVFTCSAHAGECESTFHEKSGMAGGLPRFDHGSMNFIVQPLFPNEIDVIEEGWKSHAASIANDRASAFSAANTKALSTVDIGHSSIINPSLNGPQAVISVPSVDDLCALIEQQRIVHVWPDRKIVAPILAPLSASGNRN